ncbi:uncharacterized protein [Apostichopus japonicus]|uniref:uncharacterized protein isoform X1 n=1 Tax=Stichopus japonicus TaxID=307972 RepID=UPI003AB23C8B
MPGCSAWGCSNRPENGSKLFRFPTNLDRRKTWEAKVNRLHWKANSNHKLCDAHFSEDQFEQNRVDGKRKLKSTAIPTILPHRRCKKVRKPPPRRDAPLPVKHQKLADHDYALPISDLLDSPDLDEETPNEQSSDEDQLPASDQQDAVVQAQTDPPSTSTAQPYEVRLKKTVDNLRTRLRRVRKEKRELLKAKHRQRRKLCKIFSVDQLTSLGRSSTRGVRWGDATVKKALQEAFEVHTRNPGRDDRG